MSKLQRNNNDSNYNRMKKSVKKNLQTLVVAIEMYREMKSMVILHDDKAIDSFLEKNYILVDGCLFPRWLCESYNKGFTITKIN